MLTDALQSANALPPVLLSDLAVARQQFVQPSRWNGLWGTPLYFLSQMVLAASIALV